MRKLVRMMLVCALSGAVSASCAGMSIAEEAAAEDEKATALESEKAELEERLTQLESENAELQEKLDALLNRRQSFRRSRPQRLSELSITKAPSFRSSRRH